MYNYIRMKKKYIRDGRCPIPQNAITSKIMSAIRAKNTRPERILRNALKQAGLNKFTLHLKSLPGSPDISFPKNKLAIFVNGCYWHRCPYCKPSLPKTHRSFWQNKFIKNKIRDKQKLLLLKKLGWNSIVLWECQIIKAPDKMAIKIARALKGKR